MLHPPNEADGRGFAPLVGQAMFFPLFAPNIFEYPMG